MPWLIPIPGHSHSKCVTSGKQTAFGNTQAMPLPSRCNIIIGHALIVCLGIGIEHPSVRAAAATQRLPQFSTHGGAPGFVDLAHRVVRWKRVPPLPSFRTRTLIAPKARCRARSGIPLWACDVLDESWIPCRSHRVASRNARAAEAARCLHGMTEHGVLIDTI